MKIYVCTDHDGHYPVGTSSLVLANSAAEARELLDGELKKAGLQSSAEYPYTLQQIPQTKVQAIILQDGNY